LAECMCAWVCTSAEACCFRASACCITPSLVASLELGARCITGASGVGRRLNCRAVVAVLVLSCFCHAMLLQEQLTCTPLCGWNHASSFLST
jgi:hypothetical protein